MLAMKIQIHETSTLIEQLLTLQRLLEIQNTLMEMIGMLQTIRLTPYHATTTSLMEVDAMKHTTELMEEIGPCIPYLS